MGSWGEIEAWCQGTPGAPGPCMVGATQHLDCRGPPFACGDVPGLPMLFLEERKIRSKEIYKTLMQGRRQDPELQGSLWTAPTSLFLTSEGMEGLADVHAQGVAKGWLDWQVLKPLGGRSLHLSSREMERGRRTYPCFAPPEYGSQKKDLDGLSCGLETGARVGRCGPAS